MPGGGGALGALPFGLPAQRVDLPGTRADDRGEEGGHQHDGQVGADRGGQCGRRAGDGVDTEHHRDELVRRLADAKVRAQILAEL